jgi:hypothetical protein
LAVAKGSVEYLLIFSGSLILLHRAISPFDVVRCIVLVAIFPKGFGEREVLPRLRILDITPWSQGPVDPYTIIVYLVAAANPSSVSIILNYLP